MEFSEETAKKIIEEHNLSPKTLLVWRTRGKIPDKYANPDYRRPTPAGVEKKHLKEGILRLLLSEKINLTGWTKMVGLEMKVRDVVRGKSSLSQEDLLSLKKALNKERVVIKKCVERLQNKSIFSDVDSAELKEALNSPIIVLRHLLGFGDNTDEGRVFDWKQSKQDIPDGLKKVIVDRLAVFLLETGL